MNNFVPFNIMTILGKYKNPVWVKFSIFDYKNWLCKIHTKTEMNLSLQFNSVTERD